VDLRKELTNDLCLATCLLFSEGRHFDLVKSKFTVNVLTST